MAEDQQAFLKFLPAATREQLLFILKHITRDQLSALGEVCYNVQYGAADVTSLKRHKNIIRVLGHKQTSFKKRKSLAVRHPQVVVKVVKALLP
jgi:hypothetical protein